MGDAVSVLIIFTPMKLYPQRNYLMPCSWQAILSGLTSTQTIKKKIMNNIRITLGKVIIEAKLLNTPTAQAIFNNLPFASKAQTWGDEVYFETPVQTELESDAKDVINAGEIAFWCEGSCIAIGFGPTPVSQGNEIRLAAKTNIWAKALNDVTQLKSVKPGDFIFIEAL